MNMSPQEKIRLDGATIIALVNKLRDVEPGGKRRHTCGSGRDVRTDRAIRRTHRHEQREDCD